MQVLRIGIGQINTRVGDFEGNVDKIVSRIKQAKDLGVEGYDEGFGYGLVQYQSIPVVFELGDLVSPTFIVPIFFAMIITYFILIKRNEIKRYVHKRS